MEVNRLKLSLRIIDSLTRNQLSIPEHLQVFELQVFEICNTLSSDSLGILDAILQDQSLQKPISGSIDWT